jgi:hypothetical protein
MTEADRTHLMLFGLQVTIFGGILAFTSTSGGAVLAIAALGLAISLYGLVAHGGSSHLK